MISIIDVYEANDLRVEGDKIFINNVPSTVIHLKWIITG